MAFSTLNSSLVQVEVDTSTTMKPNTKLNTNAHTILTLS